MNKKTNKRLKRWSIVLGVVAVVVIAFFVQNRQSQSSYVQSLDSTTIQRQDIVLYTLANGKITSSNTESVRFSGSLQETNVSVGEIVEEDQILATYTNALNQKVELKSPMEGVVSRIASFSSNEFLIEDQSQLQLIVNISETDIKNIDEGQSVSVFVEALDSSFDAKVSSINPVGNTSLDYTTFPITIEFDENEDISELFLGMSASAKIEIDKKENILVVPFEAIITRDTQRFVLDAAYRDDPTANQQDYERPITTGFADVFYVEVSGEDLEGLEILILPQDQAFPFFSRP